MHYKKKHVKMTGNVLVPVTVGNRAVIANRGNLVTTSKVLRTRRISKKKICFETRNTRYVLHLLSPIPLVNQKEAIYQ